MTKDALKKALDDKGVQYPETANKAELEALLEASQTTPPAGNTGGTPGNDVITPPVAPGEVPPPAGGPTDSVPPTPPTAPDAVPAEGPKLVEKKGRFELYQTPEGFYVQNDHRQRVSPVSDEKEARKLLTDLSRFK